MNTLGGRYGEIPLALSAGALKASSKRHNFDCRLRPARRNDHILDTSSRLSEFASRSRSEADARGSRVCVQNVKYAQFEAQIVEP